MEQPHKNPFNIESDGFVMVICELVLIAWGNKNVLNCLQIFELQTVWPLHHDSNNSFSAIYVSKRFHAENLPESEVADYTVMTRRSQQCAIYAQNYQSRPITTKLKKHC